MQDILELERWDGQQSTLVYWVNKTLDKVNELVNAVNKGMAQTNAQQTQAGSDASPKPCANCKYSEFGQAHPVDCLNCIHTWYERFDKFKPRTASAC